VAWASVGKLTRLGVGRARAGNLVLTTFLISLGLVLGVVGVTSVLKTQIDQATAIDRIAMAKLQVGYLAEMGLNQLMFDANLNPDAADPFGLTAGSATGKRYDFKTQVAMVRNDAQGVAECIVLRETDGGAERAFQVQARLRVPDGACARTTHLQKLEGEREAQGAREGECARATLEGLRRACIARVAYQMRSRGWS
jgi:hypothetical protein